MTIRHLTPRRPHGRGFSWGRVIGMDGALLTYNLFRRDMRGALHQKTLQYQAAVASRKTIAEDLRRARKQLRDKVDEIDLVFLEAA